MNQGIDINDLPGAPARDQGRGGGAPQKPHHQAWGQPMPQRNRIVRPGYEQELQQNADRHNQVMIDHAQAILDRGLRGRQGYGGRGQPERRRKSSSVGDGLLVLLSVLFAAALVGLAGFVVYGAYIYVVEPIVSFGFALMNSLFLAIGSVIQFILDVLGAFVAAITFVVDVLVAVVETVVAIVEFAFEVVYVLFWGIIGLIILPFWLVYEFILFLGSVLDWLFSGFTWLFGG